MADYSVIGLMSGTSLDGVDVAFCEFSFDSRWSFSLIHAVTIGYDNHWKKRLAEIHLGTAEEVTETDCLYGNYLGEIVREFCIKHNVKPDFVSSHGHTVFHQPSKGITRQIGSGAHIAARSGLPVICDFRSLDVALGGQGAPLVPIGDRYLFPEADYCLNLGGIANVSFEKGGERIAYDICACNLVLNHYAAIKGKSYDENGEMASRGKINEELLNRLNSLSYYQRTFPKSLGREDVERDIFPLIDKSKVSPEDALATFCEHVSVQVSGALRGGKVLITGGGAHHSFLVKRIEQNSHSKIVIPEKNIIDFKEAIIFAFLGVLRKRGEVNCLKSVTGALHDNCGGAIYEIKNIS